MSSNMSHEAASWFALRESGQAENEEIAQRWQKWYAEPDHRTEYVGVTQLARDLRKLPPPAIVSWRELLEDIEVGERGTH